MSEANTEAEKKTHFCATCLTNVTTILITEEDNKRRCRECGSNAVVSLVALEAITSAAKLQSRLQESETTVPLGRIESLRGAFIRMNASRKRQYFVWYDDTLRASVWTDLDNPSVEELITLAIDAVDGEGTRSWFVHAVAKLNKAKIRVELVNQLLANELISKDLANLNL